MVLPLLNNEAPAEKSETGKIIYWPTAPRIPPSLGEDYGSCSLKANISLLAGDGGHCGPRSNVSDLGQKLQDISFLLKQSHAFIDREHLEWPFLHGSCMPGQSKPSYVNVENCTTWGWQLAKRCTFASKQTEIGTRFHADL